MTWRSPDGQTYNQIDHLLIDARHVSNVMDVRTFRGANIDSEYYLLFFYLFIFILHVPLLVVILHAFFHIYTYDTMFINAYNYCYILR